MKQIPLTKIKDKKPKYFALVDDEDYEWLNQWNWCVVEDHNVFYAMRSENIPKEKRVGKTRQKTIKMHRLILGLTDPEIFGDHEDHNGLNNQKYNLRITDHCGNMSNRRSHKGSTSKYLGVCWSKGARKWLASMWVINKSVNIGWFKSEEDAARAYDAAAKIHHGEFANLNFK